MAGRNPGKLTLKHQTCIVKPKLGTAFFTRRKLQLRWQNPGGFDHGGGFANGCHGHSPAVTTEITVIMGTGVAMAVGLGHSRSRAVAGADIAGRTAAEGHTKRAACLKRISAKVSKPPPGRRAAGAPNLFSSGNQSV